MPAKARPESPSLPLTDGEAARTSALVVGTIRGPVPVPARGDHGTTTLADGVLRDIVRRALLDTPGVISHASGVTRLAGRALPRFSLSHDGEKISVDAHIAVSWPSPVALVAASARERVSAYLEAMSGLGTTAVDITVVDVVAGEPTQPYPRVTTAMLLALRSQPQLRTIRSTPLPAVSPQWEPAVIVHPVTDDPLPLQPITATEPAVYTPETAAPLPLFHPPQPPERPLRQVEAQPLSPTANAFATPQPLRDISTPRGLPVTHLRPAPPREPTPVTIPYSAAENLLTPTAQGLRPFITPVATTAPLRPITVDARPLREITVASTPLREITVTHTPLRPVEVQPPRQAGAS